MHEFNAGCSPPERVDDDLVPIALEALNGQALDVHRVKLLLCSLMQPLCPSATQISVVLNRRQDAGGEGESISTRRLTPARTRQREAESYMQLKYG
jgi:hypothetical protein